MLVGMYFPICLMIVSLCVGAAMADDPSAAPPAGNKDAVSTPGGNSTVPAGMAVKAAPLSEATETVICGNCNKEVAVTAENGQKCPHCGTIWDEPLVLPAMPAAVASAPEGAGPGETSAPPGGAHPVRAQPAQGQPMPAQGAVQNVAVPVPDNQVYQEMNLATLPLWMKALLFFGCLGVCYYMFFFRR